MDKVLTRCTLMTLLGGWLLGVGFGVASLNIARPDIAVLLKAWSGFLAIPGLALIVWAASMRRRVVAALG